jgi:hypothetical protein
MPNHYSQNRTDTLPAIKKSYSRHDTNANRDKLLKMLSETTQYKMEFNLETGDITIWYVRTDDVGIKVTTSNAEGSCTIVIEHFSLGKDLSHECHEFNPLRFSDSVTASLLTPEDLEQQRAFRQQQQERKDALERAHNSIPKTCGGYRECEHCQDEKRQHEMFYCRGYT